MADQTKVATALIQGKEITVYIKNNVTPLIKLCTDYKSNTTKALKAAQSALTQAQQAQSSALLTTAKITVLSGNINKLPTVNTAELDKLLSDITTVRQSYLSLGLSTGITQLRIAFSDQVKKISNYQAKVMSLRMKINDFKAIYTSLATMSC